MADLHPLQIFAMPTLAMEYFVPEIGAYYENVIAARSLLDRREIHLQKMMFNLRLSLTDGPMSYEYLQQYCYRDEELAWRGFETWNGVDDPVGWFKDATRNRYATPLDQMRWARPKRVQTK